MSYGSCLCLIASLTAHVKVRDHRAIHRVNPRGVLRPIAHRSDTRGTNHEVYGASHPLVPSPIDVACPMSRVCGNNVYHVIINRGQYRGQGIAECLAVSRPRAPRTHATPDVPSSEFAEITSRD